MSAFEVAVGYFISWLNYKVEYASQMVDGKVDKGIDAAVGRGWDHLMTIGNLIKNKLGGDTSLAQLEAEVIATRDARPRTRQRVSLALDDATEGDQDFKRQLNEVLELLAAERGPSISRNRFTNSGSGQMPIQLGNGPQNNYNISPDSNRGQA